MKSWPLVSIITVNYNGDQLTKLLLQSLQNITYPNYEVWVVDNGSANPPHGLQQRFPQFNFIYLNRNTGFAGGNNAAISRAHGEYVMLLNNDTEVTPNFLEPLVEKALQKGVGAVAAKLLFYGTNTLQYAGAGKLNPLTVTQKSIGYGQPDGEAYNQGHTTPYAHGAAMLVSRKAISYAGLIPEDYFLYYEELDWCRRITEQGFKIKFAPASRVYHKESMTTGRNTPFQTYWKSRGRLIFAYRNFKTATKLVALVYLLFVAMPFHMVKNIVSGQPAHSVAIAKAAGNFLFNYLAKTRTSIFGYKLATA